VLQKREKKDSEGTAPLINHKFQKSCFQSKRSSRKVENLNRSNCLSDYAHSSLQIQKSCFRRVSSEGKEEYCYTEECKAKEGIQHQEMYFDEQYSLSEINEEHSPLIYFPDEEDSSSEIIKENSPVGLPQYYLSTLSESNYFNHCINIALQFQKTCFRRSSRKIENIFGKRDERDTNNASSTKRKEYCYTERNSTNKRKKSQDQCDEHDYVHFALHERLQVVLLEDDWNLDVTSLSFRDDQKISSEVSASDHGRLENLHPDGKVLIGRFLDQHSSELLRTVFGTYKKYISSLKKKIYGMRRIVLL